MRFSVLRRRSEQRELVVKDAADADARLLGEVAVGGDRAEGVDEEVVERAVP